MHGGEGGDRGVGAGQFHRHHAVEEERLSGAAESVIGQSCQPGLPGNDLEREASSLPMPIHRRLDLGGHDVAPAVQICLFAGVEQVLQRVEVGAVSGGGGAHCCFLTGAFGTSRSRAPTRRRWRPGRCVRRRAGAGSSAAAAGARSWRWRAGRRGRRARR